MKRILQSVLVFVIGMSALTHAVTISGTVKDSVSGTALSNVYLSLRSSSTALVRDTTNETGIFSIVYETAGEYTLRATDLNGDYATKSVSVTIADADQTINILLTKAVSANVAGTVTDTNGTAVSGAVVTCSMNITKKTDTTDADGKYSIEKVLTGSYRISVSAGGYASASDSITITDATAQTKNFSLVPVVTAAVSGKISSQAGTAIAGAVVQLSKSSSMGGSGRKTDTTDADGSYSFSLVEVGNYTISVTMSGYSSVSDSVTLTDATAQTKDFKMEVEVTAKVSGKVSDEAGTAITGAVVQLNKSSSMLGSGRKTDTTDADGAYSFDAVAVGSYKITVSAGGFTSATDSVTLTDSTAQTKDIKLAAMTYVTVSGTVTDTADGAKLANVKVLLYSATGFSGTSDSAVTGSEGTFSFDSITAGTYVVSVSLDGYITKTVSLTVEDTAAAVGVQMVKKVYCSVSGTITDSATGSPLAGVDVVLRWTSGTQKFTIDSTVTDANGKYTLDSAFTGTYVRSAPDGYTRKSADLTVTTTDAKTVDLALAQSSKEMVQNGIMKTGGAGRPFARVTTGGMLSLQNITSAADVRMYSLDGRMLQTWSVAPSAAVQYVSVGKNVATGYYLINIRQRAAMSWQRIFIP